MINAECMKRSVRNIPEHPLRLLKVTSALQDRPVSFAASCAYTSTLFEEVTLTWLISSRATSLA